MKKVLAIALIAVSFAACNNSSDKKKETTDSTVVTPVDTTHSMPVDTTHVDTTSHM